MTGLGPIFAAPLLSKVDAKLLELLDSISLDEWDHETIVPGWRVRHVAAHLLDTVLRKLAVVRDGFAPERPASGSAVDVLRFVDQMNAAGVAVYGRLSPRVMRSVMGTATREAAAFHESLDPFAPAAFAVTWAGEAQSFNWFDTARELTERWHHQQQIRLALNRPDILTPELYHPVLDCFLRVLPHAYRKTEAPPRTYIRVTVTGECGGDWHLYREDAAWRLLAAAPGAAQVRITIPQEIAWRLLTKGLARADAERLVRIDGEQRLGEPIFAVTAIVG